jgi:hypothetical protein
MELEIQASCMNLLSDLSKWRTLKVLTDEDVKEDLLKLSLPAERLKVPTFLDHPPAFLSNGFYGNLLNEYRAAVIFVTFIHSPLVGAPSSFDDLRYSYAVDCCRSISATGVTVYPVPMVRILQLSGLAFAIPGHYARERAWVHEMLDKLTARGVIGGNKVKEMLEMVWASANFWRYEDIARYMQTADALELMKLEELQCYDICEDLCEDLGEYS